MSIMYILQIFALNSNLNADPNNGSPRINNDQPFISKQSITCKIREAANQICGASIWREGKKSLDLQHKDFFERNNCTKKTSIEEQKKLIYDQYDDVAWFGEVITQLGNEKVPNALPVNDTYVIKALNSCLCNDKLSTKNRTKEDDKQGSQFGNSSYISGRAIYPIKITPIPLYYNKLTEERKKNFEYALAIAYNYKASNFQGGNRYVELYKLENIKQKSTMFSELIAENTFTYKLAEHVEKENKLPINITDWIVTPQLEYLQSQNVNLYKAEIEEADVGSYGNINWNKLV